MGNLQRSTRAPIELVWPRVHAQEFVPDAAQQAVIDHDRGHLRVLAGPGTGKTSVIVASVQRRIRQGQPAGEILVLTYGRMAAEELRQRLSAGGQQVPIAFLLRFDRSQIDPKHSYAVSARITGDDGKLMFITDTRNSVAFDGASEIDLGTLNLVKTN